MHFESYIVQSIRHTLMSMQTGADHKICINHTLTTVYVVFIIWAKILEFYGICNMINGFQWDNQNNYNDEIVAIMWNKFDLTILNIFQLQHWITRVMALFVFWLLEFYGICDAVTVVILGHLNALEVFVVVEILFEAPASSFDTRYRRMTIIISLQCVRWFIECNGTVSV